MATGLAKETHVVALIIRGPHQRATARASHARLTQKIDAPEERAMTRREAMSSFFMILPPSTAFPPDRWRNSFAIVRGAFTLS
jgi:hypothetical protein